MTGMRRIVIVGGGASGVLLAVHLLRHRPDGLIVTLVEKRPELGAGVAYATRHPDHLLNVRASNMSAFPDDPGHFARWLAGTAGTGNCGPDGFAPRRLYRDYLAHLTDPLFLDGQLRRVRGEAVALRDDASGVEVLCRREGGPETALRGDVAVVATGNEGPSLPPEPWRYAGWGGEQERPPIPHDAPVVVIGTGLTMVDRVMWLLHDGHSGPITAVSRHGLMPQAHRPAAAFAVGEVPFGAPVLALTGWLRGRAAAAERAGAGWRAAVDGLRPHTQALWAGLPEAERRRFLRHARPFWDVHRHRIAPQAEARLDEARARGQLRVLAGHVTGFDPCPGGVAVSVKPRGAEGAEVLEAAAVFECRGRAADVTRSENPALQDLLRGGRARPDALGLGLDVTDGCALVDAAGRASDRLFAAGPVTAGTFWEIVAVPDIRQQAARLAGALLAGRAAADAPDREVA
ncbi:FAD/NAD(P)-binding protein [Lichenibacterium dinghuense]|uniref:FAD/NAD(P)-binding protein n=1 Tax=Lichenibacterium dinghuense TaxID=2895977 RepID=UPI001F1F2FDE|nr:FAD/NAD(P)-binding protein [Lichenibacterium sp. 6Y81]